MQIEERVYKVSDLDRSVLSPQQKSFVVRLVNRTNQLYSSNVILLGVDKDGFVTFGSINKGQGKEYPDLVKTASLPDMASVVNQYITLLYVMGMLDKYSDKVRGQWNDTNVDMKLLEECMKYLSIRIHNKTGKNMSIVVKMKKGVPVICPVCMGFEGPEMARGGDDDKSLLPVPDIWLLWSAIRWMRDQTYFD